jgi:amino acid adenylation domain-containing protein
MHLPEIIPSEDFIHFDEVDATNASLVSRFEEIADKYPDQIAITAQGKSQTYRELNQFGNRIAREILSQGGKEGLPIAILLDHSIGAIASLIGILKTGSPYVPLNLSYPGEKLAAILYDAGVNLVLTDTPFLAVANTALPLNGKLINLDMISSKGISDNLNRPISIYSPASIFYTSGSTGQPKGVVYTHRALVYHSFIDTNALFFSPSDRVSLFNALSFSASRFCVFNALLNGATLCLYDFKTNSVDAAIEWVRDQKITILKVVPAFFKVIYRSLSGQSPFPSLRFIHLGGEAITMIEIDLYRAHSSPSCLLITSLGSTEAGMLTYFPIDHYMPLDGEIIPVGLPLPDKSILLLNENGEPVSTGEIGEIVVNSDYIAEGYWKQPAWTAQKFHADPQDNRRRIFSSGDLGRWREDGLLEYRGRKDDQVKIRGYRIELEEVRAALYQNKAIKDVYIVARTSPYSPDEKQLVAYIIPVTKQAINSNDLRQFLCSRLPDYMIPTWFVFLDALPLNPHGKVDVRVLPAPSREASGPYTPPSNLIEHNLLQIWAQAFGIGDIGIKDDFFELGGNSLLGAMILVDINEKFGQHIPLALFSEYRTIEQMAQFLQNKDASRKDHSLVAIQPLGKKPILFMLPGHGGDVFYFREFAKYLGNDQPVYGLELGIFGTATKPSIDLVETAKRYFQEVQEFQPTGPYYLLGHSFGGVLAFEIAHQMIASGEKVGFLGLLDSYPPGIYPKASFIERILIHRDNLRDLTWEEQISYFLARIKALQIKFMRFRWLRLTAARWNFIPKDVSSVNMIALRGYTAHPYPDKITLFSVREHAWYIHKDPTEGWHRYAGSLDIHLVPGNHSSLLREPHLAILADEVKNCLKAAQD